MGGVVVLILMNNAESIEVFRGYLEVEAKLEMNFLFLGFVLEMEE